MTHRIHPYVFAATTLAALTLASACRQPGAATESIPSACDGLFDADLQLRRAPTPVVSFSLDDGAPGYEYQMLMQVDAAGTLTFADVRWGKEGPNGLADRKKAPGTCFTRHLTAAALRDLETTLETNHVCSQKRVHADPDISPYRIAARFGTLRCDVAIDSSNDDRDEEGKAIYQALALLGPPP